MKTITLAAILTVFAVDAHAVDVRLGWDPNLESDLAGYYIFQAEVRGDHTTAWTQIADVLAPAVTYLVTGLPDNKNFVWYATAYDTGGQESRASNMQWRWKPKPDHPQNLEKQEP